MNNYALKVNFNSRKEVNMENVLALKVTTFLANRPLFIRSLAVNDFRVNEIALVGTPIK
jgi:hypothetical protein